MWRPPHETPTPPVVPELPEPPAESPLVHPVEVPEPAPERREKPFPELAPRRDRWPWLPTAPLDRWLDCAPVEVRNQPKYASAA